MLCHKAKGGSTIFIINNNSNITIYDQIIDNITQLIAINALKPNDRLPSIRALATELVINPNTVAKAYQKLDDMGVIYNQRGIGYFVSDNISSIIDDKNKKTQDEFAKNAKMLLSSGKTKQQLINIINELEGE